MKKTFLYIKERPVIAVFAAALAVCVILSAVLGRRGAEIPAPASSVGGVYGSTSISQEELEKIDFALSNTDAGEIDSAVGFVNSLLEKEASQPYTLSFERLNVNASEDATVWLRRSFFSSDYAERNRITDDYVNSSVIAVIAEYNVDYDNDAVPYEDGRITKAYYLLRNDASGEWTVWKSETLSAE